MKKNLGNAVVKRVISTAMAAMLVFATPAVNAVAAEEVPVVELSVEGATEGEAAESKSDLQKLGEELQEKLDPNSENFAFKEYDEEQTKQQQELAQKIADKISTDKGISEIDTTKDSYDIVDEFKDKATEIIKDTASEEISKQTEAAKAASEEAKAGVEGVITEEAKQAVANEKNYIVSTDTLLKEDADIVKDVDGNVVLKTEEDGSETRLVNTITSEGDVKLNIEDSEGNKVDVVDYTAEKAATAKDAADQVDSIVENVDSLTTDAAVKEASETINTALNDAVAAKDEAEAAYKAANSVLLDEIKRYNAYVKYYGLSEDQYTKCVDSDNNEYVPEFTEEELNAFLAKEGLSMNKAQIEAGLNSVDFEKAAAILSEKKVTVDAAYSYVDGCQKSVDNAYAAVDLIKDTEQRLLTIIDDNIAKMEEEIANVPDDKKEELQNNLKTLKDCLAEYTRELDQTPHATEEDPNAERIDNYQTRFYYVLDATKKAADTLNTLVGDAEETLDTATTAYNEASALYDELKAQYDAAVNDRIGSNLTALKAKMEAAKVNVDKAKANLDDAVKSVNRIKDLQKQFNDAVAKPENGGGNDDNGDNGGNGGSSESGSTTETAGAAATVATTTLAPTATALAATITDETTPLADSVDGLTTIPDGMTALYDSVPKTGDASTSAMPFALGAFAAFAGALATRIRRKTDR